jgi:hypothetical protein
METLDLNEAAKFLFMNAEALRRKASAGEIPGRKTGKRWVFIKEHLADWVSGRYPDRGQTLRVIDGGLTTTGVIETCQSTSETKRGGFKLPQQMESEYNALLDLK